MCLKSVIFILLFSLLATNIALIAALNKPCPNEEKSLSENNNDAKKFGIEGDAHAYLPSKTLTCVTLL